MLENRRDFSRLGRAFPLYDQEVFNYDSIRISNLAVSFVTFLTVLLYAQCVCLIVAD